MPQFRAMPKTKVPTNLSTKGRRPSKKTIPFKSAKGQPHGRPPTLGEQVPANTTSVR